MECIYIKNLRGQKSQGFTLIELLVVIIIMGVLSALALPSLLSQVGKAREVEAKNHLGAISRAQQAYFFEKQVFTSEIDYLNISSLNNTRYYTFPDPTTTSDTVKHQAIAIDPTTDIVRNFAVGVYHNAGIYSVVFCQSQDINTTVNAPNSNAGSCTDNGTQLR